MQSINDKLPYYSDSYESLSFILSKLSFGVGDTQMEETWQEHDALDEDDPWADSPIEDYKQAQKIAEDI